MAKRRKKTHEEYLKQRQLHSMYWNNKSSDLHGAAAALWYSQDEAVSDAIVKECGLGEGWFRMSAAVTPVYYMLCGLSLELIYKAILWAKAIRFDFTHKLVDLAKAAGVEPEGELQGLLETMTEFVIWYGKYPIPSDQQYGPILTKLIHRNLYDRKRMGSLNVLAPNEALSWKSFDKLWQQGSHLYFVCKPKEWAADLRVGMSKENVVKKHHFEDVAYLDWKIADWVSKGKLTVSDYTPTKSEKEGTPADQ
jgi:hypothetical protein